MKKNVTKVPNGPLVKKKGQFKGSTLKAGGKIKKAMNGATTTTTAQTTQPVNIKLTPQQKRAQLDSIAAVRRADIVRKKDSILERNAAARGMTREEVRAQQKKDATKPDAQLEGTRCIGKDNEGCARSAGQTARRIKREAKRKNGGPVKKAMIGTGIFKNNPITKKANTARGLVGKAYGLPGGVIAKNGEMIKRADGSYSKRGLWDNIRANKGSGKKPTKQMLQQEKKIKAKTKK